MTRDYIKQRAEQTTPEYREKKRVRDGKYREIIYNKLTGTTRKQREEHKARRKREVIESKKERKKKYSTKIKLSKKMKEKMKNYKNDKSCSVCGYNKFPKILHFHHIKDKKEDISKIKGWEKFFEEIKKCIILCPNCHAEIHLK